jgi:lysophospholipase L1-like esterase
LGAHQRALGNSKMRLTRSPTGLCALFDGQRLELADWNAQMRSRFASCWVPTNASYSPCFIDIFADLADTDLNINPAYDGDGIHLNDAGHRVIFQNAIEIIEPYLCGVTACR